jgi:hypothetical protein
MTSKRSGKFTFETGRMTVVFRPREDMVSIAVGDSDPIWTTYAEGRSLAAAIMRHCGEAQP